MSEGVGHPTYWCSVTGHTLQFEVEPTDTIERLAEKIQQENGIPVSIQCLFWAGKQLELHRSLASYDIQRKSVLHLVWRSWDDPYTRMSDVPIGGALPTEQEALQRIGQWRALADKGNFDADTHIVDPHAHYEALDSLQQMIVKSSEFYRQSGVYRLSCTGEAPDLQHLVSTPTAPQWISNLVLDLQGGNLAANEVVFSLCEVYLMVHSVINSFDILESRQFCTSFFSILVERCDGAVAEIVKIYKNLLVKLRDSLKVAIVITHNNGVDLESDHEMIMNSIWPAAQEFLDILNFKQLGSDAPIMNTLPEMLNLYHMVACILDLGLVSYVGSHAARFDTEIFQRDMNSFRFDLRNNISFDCSLRTLACLDGFLDAKSVWVFRAGVNLPSASLERATRKKKKLFVLTTIDSLADIWGSVWAEAVGQVVAEEKGAHVKKYHVSKGVIRRVREDSEPLVPGAVKCHWYSWTQDYRRRFSTLLTKTDELTMAVNDKLLIGNDIRINDGCTYSLQEYEMNYSDMINTLGTMPSAWKLDGVTLSVQLTAPKVVAFQIQGNVKKVPETTIKQHLWTKWSLQPERANPGILNNYFGVEISHCTGNARRVPFKYILLMEPVQDLLERQIPKWSTSTWGISFQKALMTDSNDAIFQFWNDHVEQRPLVGQLVRCVLDILDSTGKTDFGFRAAFLHKNRELGVDLDIDNNEWLGLLRDSYLMATYAIIHKICLDCRQPDHTTSTCGDKLQYTVLQTQIGFKMKYSGSMSSSNGLKRLKIEPHNQTYKTVNGEGGAWSVSHFMAPEPSFKRLFLFNSNITIAKELLAPSYYSLSDVMPKKQVKVILRASGRSYGGMSYKRNRTLLKDANTEGSFEIQDPVEVNEEALSQLEIEAINPDEMKSDQQMRRLT